jgi:hypothetical protein
VNEGRRLQRLARFLLCHPLCGELAQLLVDQRQELLRGMWIAPFDGRQNARDLVHWPYLVGWSFRDKGSVAAGTGEFHNPKTKLAE